MPRAKAKPSFTDTEAEGVVFISTAGSYYVNPTVDAKSITDALGNPHITQILEKMQNLIFTDSPVIQAIRPDGEIDEECSRAMTDMARNKNVQLFARMKNSWVDQYGYGCGFFSPAWQWIDGTYTLTELKRLSPDSFDRPPSSASKIYSEILRGVTLDESGNPQFWQRDSENSNPKQVKNIYLVKDPMSTQLCGSSKVLPLLSIISMLDFIYKALMQKLNRIGAPVIFIKVTKPIIDAKSGRNDITYANKLLENWGKDTAFQLRENMEVVNLNITDESGSLAAIEHFEQFLQNYVSPASILATMNKGTVLGGNSDAEHELIQNSIRGILDWTEDAWEPLLQIYLDANLYEGYHVEIKYPEQTSWRLDSNIKIAQVGFQTRTMLPNEIREKLNLPPMDEERMQELMDFYSTIPATQSIPGEPILNKTKDEGARITKAIDVELKKNLDDFENEFLKIVG